jgi:two-component system cell cycle sensor histidine kinase/response regulator CckA
MEPKNDQSDGLDAIDDPRGLLAGLFEHSPVAFQIFRADGHCMLVNRAFRELIGSVPPPEYNVLEDDVLERQGFLDLIRRAFAGETMHVPPQWYDPRNLRQVTVTEGRPVGIAVTLFPLRDASGAVRHVALCSRDVTAELTLAETARSLEAEIAERKAVEEQLRQSQKMEAVGLLAGGVAHDFNNLLSVIMSYSDLLLKDARTEPSMRRDLAQILAASEQAAGLTRKLLAFSRRQVLTPRVLDLNDILGSMEEMVGRMIGEDVRSTFELASKGSVHVDAGQMEQVLMNLVVNARDAMPNGGMLTIKTADVDLDGEYAKAHFDVEPGLYVMLSVSDTGVGMSAATRARIFEPFFTTKEQGKGTGLGLSTVFGIVKQSGGNVWVYSEAAKGTTFKVFLPRVATPEATSITRNVSPRALEGSETILLVEDDHQVRELARVILAKYGYDVLVAASSEDALRECERLGGKIHLVLTDVVMPEMSGRELAERLSREYPTIKVVFMSGYTDDAIVRHGALSSTMTFIQKPLMPEPLLAKIRDVLDGPGG